MRKVCGLVFVFIMILLVSVSAAEVGKIDDDFVIRGGVKFGMTIDEVKKIERTANSLTPSKTDENRLGYRVSSIIGVEIGSANGDTIEYKFDNGKLHSLHYWYGYYKSSVTADSSYEEIVSTITQKYGKPLHNNDGELFPIYSDALHSYLHLVQMGIDYRMRNCCEWLIEFNDTYVVIDAFCYSTNPKYSVEVGFKSISREEVLAIMEKSIQKENEKSTQKQNDI